MNSVTLILILLSHFSIAQTNLRYEGYIENSGTPVNATSQNFTVHILNPICATPLISSTATADIVSGEFNIAPSFADSNLFSSIMNPAYTNGSCPAPSANRTFRIEWNAQTFDIAMNDAARSSFSNASAKLGERTQDQFLKVDTNTSYTPLTTTNVSTLLDLIAGTNTQYLRPSNSFGGDISGVYNALSVNRLRGTNVAATAPTANQVLKFNGTDWAPATDDTGSATDASYATKGLIQVNTSAAISGLDLTAGILSLANTGTPGTYGSSTLIPVITTDNKGRITNVVNTSVVTNDSTKLPLTGGAMTGSINMGSQNISNATSVASTNFSGRNFLAYDADSSNSVTIRTPANVLIDYSLTLPSDDGTPGQFLSTDGAGVLSWSTAAINYGLGAFQTPQVGGTAMSANGVVLSNATNTGLMTMNCSLNQIIKFDVSGNAYCSNDLEAPTNTVLSGGNSFGSSVLIGSNDNQSLEFETNNIVRMRIFSNGNMENFRAVDTYGSTGHGNAPAGQGRIYFDSTSNKYKVSQSGTDFQDLVAVRFPADTTTGSSIAIGANTLQFQITPAAYNNIALGFNALSSSSISPLARNNIAIGRNVLDSITTGKFNIGIGGDDTLGNYTLGNLTTGEENTAIGSASGAGLTSGIGNTALGFNSFTISASGNDNTYIGSESGTFADADNDTAIGIRTLRNSQNGFNTAIGAQALESVTGGTDNIGIGYRSGLGLTSGSNNILMGSFSGSNITTGTSNLILGNNVGTTTLQTGNGNILIGTSSLVDTPTSSTSQFLNIGNAIYGNLTSGNIGIGTSSPAAKLEVNGSVKLGVGSSTLSRVIFCNPSVNLSIGIISPGLSSNVQTAASSCPGIQQNMVVNCSWVSESVDLGRLGWKTILTNASDETNQAIRIRFTSYATSGTLPTSATTLSLACIAYKP